MESMCIAENTSRSLSTSHTLDPTLSARPAVRSAPHRSPRCPAGHSPPERERGEGGVDEGV